MRKLPKLGQPTANGYRVSKGMYVNGDKLSQKFFWVGHDARLAVEKIMSLEDIAATQPTNVDRKLIWDAVGIAKVKTAFDAIDAAAKRANELLIAPPATPSAPVSVPVFAPQPLPPRPDLANLTLHTALDQYVAHVNGRNEIGLKTKTMTLHRVRSLKHHLPDVALATIQFEQLQQFRNAFTARPLCRRQRRKGTSVKAARPISVMTARNWLSTLGQAFRWFRKTNRWVKPLSLDAEDLEQVFFLSKSERTRICNSRDERQKLGKPKPTPTLDELCLYYKLAAPGPRLYLLMGVCLGWRQKQITELRKPDHLSWQ